MSAEDFQPDFSLPAETRWPLFFYNLLFPFVLLALLPGVAARMFRRGGYRAKFGQRLGRFTPEDRARFAAREWTWVHSISVGETLLALKLARKMHDLDPAKNIVLSVTTSTGFAVAHPAACDWLEVNYNPLDTRAIVRRTLRVLRPRQIIFIEAIWPNLLAEAKRRGIPASLIARLSPRSERRFRKARALTGPIFRLLDLICVQEPDDVARWESLGVSAERVHNTGNIKFDFADSHASRDEEFRLELRKLGVPDAAPILLAGSTFPGEEKIVGEIFRELRAEYAELFLIVVPRHVERARSVLAELTGGGLKVVRRTDLAEASATKTDGLLVDTTGELRDWYRLATVVFIGKSLTGRGGQNPVEAVVAGKPVVCGPHMENFAAITRQLVARGAILQATDALDVRAKLAGLLGDPVARAEMATRGRADLLPHQHATERTAGLLAFST